MRGRSKVSPTATAVAADVPGPEAVLTARHLAGYCPSLSAYQGRALLDVDPADAGVGEREQQLGHLGTVVVELADAPLRRHEHGERQNRHQSLTALSAMALAVLVAAERRIGELDHDSAEVAELLLPFADAGVHRIDVRERPPLIR